MHDTNKTEVEDRLVIWWGPDIEDENVFVLPVFSVEEGVKTLGTLTSYDAFLVKNNYKEDKPSNGALAFLTPEGELKPWSYVSIARGGKKFDDPMEWLEEKYSRQQIVV